MNHKARERLTLIEQADKLRCGANLALTLQPFCNDDEALIYSIENYSLAANTFVRAGLSLMARDCWLSAAQCCDRLGRIRKAASLRHRAEGVEIAWEGSGEK